MTSIGSSAFSECPLTTVTLPGSLTNLGAGAFAYCFGLRAAYFQGNAPGQPGNVGTPVFDQDKATAYYLPGTSGWSTNFSGIPTALWTLSYPLVLQSSVGARHDEFGFTVSWATNLSVVVETSTDLTSKNWTPLQTNALNNGVVSFSDPQWTNYPSRFYRVRSQ